MEGIFTIAIRLLDTTLGGPAPLIVGIKWFLAGALLVSWLLWRQARRRRHRAAGPFLSSGEPVQPISVEELIDRAAMPAPRAASSAGVAKHRRGPPHWMTALRSRGD